MKSYIAIWQDIIERKVCEEPTLSRMSDLKPTEDKPEVAYIGQPRFALTNGNWVTATVYATNHYYVRIGVLHTSPVIRLYDDGSFETFNTLYKPSSSPDNEEVYDEESMTA